MRIAQLSSNVERVPPVGYGGTELVVSLLTEELVNRGHAVTLFGVGDTSARLVSVVDEPLRTSVIPVRRWAAYDIMLLTKLHEMRDQFDVVHNHMGWQALPWLAQLGVPSVTTNHNIVKPYCASIYIDYKQLPFVAISDAYRRQNYPNELNYVATIYNGIEVDRFSAYAHKFDHAMPEPQVFDRKYDAGACTATLAEHKTGVALAEENPHSRAKSPGSYLLFLGRLCADKGTEQAIQVAQRLGVPVILAGKVDATDQEYFRAHVEPYLSRPGVQFIGEVNHDEKVRLYSDAIATIYPVNFEEPFGLVMAESLASGTPVMAFDRGSVREVLSDGETAVIGATVDDLVSRFDEVKSIDPELCRRRAVSMFSSGRMVQEYEDVYERLIGGSR